LDMGFERDMTKIMDALPAIKQTALFSATLTREVITASRIKPDNVVEVSTVNESESAINQECLQEFITVENEEMIPILNSLLVENMGKKVVVFFQTARMVDFFTDLFNSNGHRIEKLTGKMSQNARTRTFFQFSKTAEGILFSTDVSARGLDIPGVDVIIQVGTPDEMEDYIHRIGRTSRAGLSGRAILFVKPHEAYFVSKLKAKRIIMKDLIFQPAKKKIDMNFMNRDIARGAYSSYMGYVTNHLKYYRWSKQQGVDEAVKWGKMVGLRGNDLEIEKKTLRKMGIQLELLWKAIGV